MNGKGPLTPTEQALMRLHNYDCSTNRMGEAMPPIHLSVDRGKIVQLSEVI
jgi:hypothetical protein